MSSSTVNAPFSRRDALSFGWHATWRHLGVIGGVLLIWLIVSLLQGALIEGSAGARPTLHAFIALGTQLLHLAVWMAMLSLALRLHDRRPTRLGDLVPSLTRYLDFIAGVAVYTVLVMIGLVLLVVPGIYLAVRFGFTKVIIVDQGIDPLSALRRSAELTRGVRGRLFLFWLLLAGVNLLGLLAFGVGLLVTVPVTVLATVHVYRSLLQRERAVATLITPSPQPRRHDDRGHHEIWTDGEPGTTMLPWGARTAAAVTTRR